MYGLAWGIDQGSRMRQVGYPGRGQIAGGETLVHALAFGVSE